MRRSRGGRGNTGHTGTSNGSGQGHSGNQGYSNSGNQGRRSSTPNRNQVFDSNGPEVRIRGNAWQVYEKYQALARDAQSAGDRVKTENLLQHAEHYFRIISAINEAAGEMSPPRNPAQQAEYTDDGQPQSQVVSQGGGHTAQPSVQMMDPGMMPQPPMPTLSTPPSTIEEVDLTQSPKAAPNTAVA